MSKSDQALIQAFLSNGGKITRCPPKKVAPTRATLPHPSSNAYKEMMATLNA